MYQFDPSGEATTTAVLAAVAEALPDQSFVVADDGELTYREMSSLSVDLAAGFTALGLRTGERVGILLPNGIRWCAALFGAHAAGLSVVPLNTWYRRDELASVARRAGLRTIITQTEIFGFESASAATGLDVAGYLGPLLWPAGAPRPVELSPALATGDAITALRRSAAAEAADALVVFTSGSSAAPKAVRLTQGGLARTGYAIGERQGVSAGDRFWFASPLFFVFGCANALPNALTHAATLCLQERFEAASALEFIERHRCTIYYGVGPVTRALAACEDLPTRDISSLRTGTANATPEDLRLAMDVLGVQQVCNAYGLTESYGHSTITAHTDPADARTSSQGTVLPTQQLRIVADGVVAPTDVAGEIQIRGLITPGYLDDVDTTTRAFDRDGWFRTGDIGLIDAHHRLHYLGRRDDTMKVQGINVSPMEIELLLVQHNMIDEAFVFGLATAEGDQSVGCVLVSPVPPHERCRLERDVQTWIRQRAASYKVPTTIRIIAPGELPLTATGKVSKRLLKEQTLT
jgi:acyl-CoA synthetase (AMP-forming)/AMP-acid ligase II